MSNAIEACTRAGAKLLFFDNVYMYGKVAGPMTEETSVQPVEQQGRGSRSNRDHAHRMRGSPAHSPA